MCERVTITRTVQRVVQRTSIRVTRARVWRPRQRTTQRMPVLTTQRHGNFAQERSRRRRRRSSTALVVARYRYTLVRYSAICSLLFALIWRLQNCPAAPFHIIFPLSHLSSLACHAAWDPRCRQISYLRNKYTWSLILEVPYAS